MTPPVWMVRVNPLPRRRLPDPELAHLVEEWVARECAAGPLAERASEDLHRLVPTVDQARRGPLLALRRDIHNGRTPAPEALAVLATMPASVARWSANHRALEGCRSALARRYPAALERERHRLRQLLGDDNFLVTLARSAPGVHDAAVRYRAHRRADAKDRKAERSLLQYLTRAMVRTSPYGRFTSVGLVEPAPGGIAMDEVTAATASAQVELDRAMFDYVAAGLMPPAEDPWVCLAPTARVSNDRVTFFQVRGDAMRRLSAPRTGATETLVGLLDLGPRRRSELAVALAAQLGIERAEADRLVGSALGVGLAVTSWRGDEFVAEPVEEALRDLAVAGQERHLDALDRLRAGIARLGDPHEGGDARVSGLRQLDHAGEVLCQAAQRPARLAVNEDFILEPTTVDTAGRTGALDDLSEAAALLWLFDRALVTRSLLAATVVERFGPGCRVPLVLHAESLARAVYQAERLLEAHPDAPLGPADGSLAALVKLRREALAAWRDPLAAWRDSLDAQRDAIEGDGHRHRDPADGEVVLAPRVASELVAALPERFLVDPASYGLVVQFAGPRAVLNDAYAGHGPMLSRFLHADEQRGGTARGRLRDGLRDLYGPATRLVEDGGRYGLAINAHPPVLDHALDPAGWESLLLAHDPDTDTVGIVDRDGRPVRVLALGAQMPELFPYPVRLATWLCSSGRVVLDLPAMLRRPAWGPTATATAGGPTVPVRRLRLGQVVICRRRWYPGADFPSPVGRDDLDYLLALSAWRARHGVPAEVMLKSVFDGPTMWESLANPQAREMFFDLRRQSKPQYVDLASALVTRVLPRLLERRPPGFIEEAMPALSAGGHAAEWMITVSRPAGRTEFRWRPEPQPQPPPATNYGKAP